MNNPEEKLSRKNIFDLYENGKHRRYSLLFSVNGGAFAIAKLLVEAKDGQNVLGGLTITHLAIGMILFTSIMVYDIYQFGKKMKGMDESLFGNPGKAVLGLLGVLICVGWWLVGNWF